MQIKKIIPIIIVLLILLALPVTIFLIKQQSDNRSRAAAPDQLEAEGGVLGGNAKIQTDSFASGGNYVLFGGFSITSGPTSQSITANSAEITWTLSENATGQVEYGTTTSYGTLSSPENSFTYSTHIQTLSGLQPGTTYHYRVKSSNQAGTQVVSGDNTFTTTQGQTSSGVGTGGTYSSTHVNVTGGGSMPSVAGAISAATYGAVGNGTADDTSALQTAANTAAAAGKPLVIPYTSAYYKISAPITLKVSIIGTGNGMPTIKQSNNNGNYQGSILALQAGMSGWVYNLHLVGQYDGTYYNFRDGTYPQGEWAHAINLGSVNGVTIKGNLIETPRGDGITDGIANLTSPAKNVLIDNNTINNALRCAISSTTNTDGWAIFNNRIIHQSRYVDPIDLEPDEEADYVTNYEFGYNDFTSTTPYELFVLTGWFDHTPGGNIWIHDNYGSWAGAFSREVGFQGAASNWFNVNISNNTKTR